MELDLRSILEELVILRADAMDAFAGKDSIYQSCLKEEDETWKQCKKAGIKMTKELDLYLGASLSSHHAHFLPAHCPGNAGHLEFPAAKE